MVHTKNTERKHFQGLPRARFLQVATGVAERDKFYCLTLQLPPTVETDWTSLTPSGVTSPELERMVDCLNAEHQSAMGDDIREVVELVEDLHDNPPASSTGEPEPVVQDSDGHPLEQVTEMVVEETSSTTGPPPTISTETVAETAYPPMLLARRATAMSAPRKSTPPPPTAGTKCPRPEFHSKNEEVNRRKKPKSKTVSALEDIRKYQTEVKLISHGCPL